MTITRPQLKNTLTTSDKILEGLCWGALALMWLFAFLMYSQLPDIIPTHFNGAGEVDGSGPKYSLFFLPLLTTMLVLMFGLLKRYSPGLIYLEDGISDAEAGKKYRIIARGLRFVRLFLTVLFGVILWYVVKTAQLFPMPEVSANWPATGIISLLTVVFVMSFPVVIVSLLSRNAAK